MMFSTITAASEEKKFGFGRVHTINLNGNELLCKEHTQIELGINHHLKLDFTERTKRPMIAKCDNDQDEFYLLLTSNRVSHLEEDSFSIVTDHPERVTKLLEHQKLLDRYVMGEVANTLILKVDPSEPLFLRVREDFRGEKMERFLLFFTLGRSLFCDTKYFSTLRYACLLADLEIPRDEDWISL